MRGDCPVIIENRFTLTAVMAALLLFSGCTASKPWFTKAGPAAVPPPEVMQSAQPEAPYLLTAEAVGQCINFTLANTSQGDLTVEPANFALIPRGTRRVVPYDTENATIDVPPVIAPGQIVTGRAVFKQCPEPVGDRLVFKPDQIGTFATITHGAMPSGAPGAPLN